MMLTSGLSILLRMSEWLVPRIMALFVWFGDGLAALRVWDGFDFPTVLKSKRWDSADQELGSRLLRVWESPGGSGYLAPLSSCFLASAWASVKEQGCPHFTISPQTL